VPIVRPPSHAAHHLTRPLDAGALGLLVPQVETAEQAQAIVQQAKYHQLGRRGFSGRGAHTNYQRQPPKTMMARANDDTLIAVMVESIRGIEQVDEIASVPGIDAIVIGRGDLSQDMGIPGEVESPRVEAAIDRVLDTCQQQNVAAGILCFDTESAEQWLARGIRLLNYSSDVALIVDAATKALETVRGFCDEQDIPTLRPWE
jgi:2-keto-3-deoxy-L-rhamnonate aldolase RhmA